MLVQGGVLQLDIYQCCNWCELGASWCRLNMVQCGATLLNMVQCRNGAVWIGLGRYLLVDSGMVWRGSPALFVWIGADLC